MIVIRISRRCRFNNCPDTLQPYFWTWLVDNFGHPNVSGRWFFDANTDVTFVNDVDAVAFTVVWASDIENTTRIS